MGIFILGLPTTPFLLMAAALFFRSSERLYNWLISSRLFGKYIAAFRKNRGITLKVKLFSITLMWIMISLSVFFIESSILRIILLILGIIGTAVMGFFIRTIKKKEVKY